MTKNQENPKVSIIMGIYNCSQYLEESIDSILNQTYSNWELVMCDDGSNDDTLKIALNYEKKFPKKIKVLTNSKNMGLNLTLNKCLEVATGDYIARQDGDDISLPTRLEEEVKFLDEHPFFGLVSTNMTLFDEKSIWGQTNMKEYPQNNDFLFGVPFVHAAVMIRTSILKEVGGYTVDKKLLRVEDYHLWFKIYELGYKGYNIQKELYMMRDDRDAYKRRKFQYRLNEMYVRWNGYKMLKIPFYKRIYALRPIFVGLLPEKLYMYLHKNKLKRR